MFTKGQKVYVKDLDALGVIIAIVEYNKYTVRLLNGDIVERYSHELELA